MSLPRAGEVLGRDHSTILYAVRKIEARLLVDEPLRLREQAITARAALATARPAEA